MINDDDLLEETFFKINIFIIYWTDENFHFTLNIHCHVDSSQRLTCLKILII